MTKVQALYSNYCELSRKEFEINEDRLHPDWSDRIDAVRAERVAVATEMADQPAGSIFDIARKGQVIADLTNGVQDDNLVDTRDLLAFDLADDAIRLGIDPIPPQCGLDAKHQAAMRAQPLRLAASPMSTTHARYIACRDSIALRFAAAREAATVRADDAEAVLRKVDIMLDLIIAAPDGSDREHAIMMTASELLCDFAAIGLSTITPIDDEAEAAA